LEAAGVEFIEFIDENRWMPCAPTNRSPHMASSGVQTAAQPPADSPRKCDTGSSPIKSEFDA
jgi:hypothetical protein